jgi:hypothetical protein
VVADQLATVRVVHRNAPSWPPGKAIRYAGGLANEFRNTGAREDAGNIQCYIGRTAPRRPGLRARTGGDYSLPEAHVPACVVVFLDWQNVYNSAREMYETLQAPQWRGQVDP